MAISLENAEKKEIIMMPCGLCYEACKAYDICKIPCTKAFFIDEDGVHLRTLNLQSCREELDNISSTSTS